MKQIPYLGPTNIRRHRVKFSRHGDLAPNIFVHSLKMVPIRCPETSVNSYHTTPRNIP
jgi:hypothetical protein